MKKKRREIENFKVVDLAKQKLTLKTYLSKQIDCCEHCGLKKTEYLVLPEYGKGTITEFNFEGVTITINNFMFHQNFLFYNELSVNALYLSFMIKGETLIQIQNTATEMVYEENESFMAYIERYNATLKIYDKMPFKEVNVIIGQDFLKKYGLNDASEFKNIIDENLILPITDTMFSVLEALEMEYGKGLVQRLFLESKVMEMIAMQLGNYKIQNDRSLSLSNQKSIKKLFFLKQFLKDNLDKNYTIHELAKEIGLSEHLLKSEFKRIFNCSVNQYFSTEKMKKAKHLLQNTESPIYQIAEDVGYKNATHFSAAFKRFYNETPKICRIKI